MNLHASFLWLFGLFFVLSVRASPLARTGTAPCAFPSLTCSDGIVARCLAVNDICNGVNNCHTGIDENDCEGEGYVINVNLISSRDEDTIIEEVSTELCAKFCNEEDRFHCIGFQHNFQSNSCRLLDAQHVEKKVKPSLRSFWITFVKSNIGSFQIPVVNAEGEPEKEASDDRNVDGLEGGFDAIIVEADLDSLIPERRKRHLAGPLSRTFASCGKRSIDFEPPPPESRFGRVVGGIDAPVGAYPWQVAIKLKNENSSLIWCGGAIIDRKYILTAAHCIDRFHRQKGEFVVVVGEHDLQVQSTKEQIFEVENFVTHKNYKSDTKKGNDIAIVKLAGQGITFNDMAQPICLPTSEKAYKDGTMCEVSGWGLQKAGDKDSVAKVLQVASVPLISNDVCIKDEVYGKVINLTNLRDSMVCAGYLEGKTDSCKGDSGGPLACRNINGQFELLGLVSWGDVTEGGCARKDKPGVYTKILKFLDWIREETTNDNETTI